MIIFDRTRRDLPFPHVQAVLNLAKESEMASIATVSRWINVAIVDGGALGTMTITPVLADTTQKVTSGTGSSWEYQLPGDPTVIITFPAGTYVAADVYSFGPDGAYAHSGTGAPVPTIRSKKALPGVGLDYPGSF